MTYACLNFLSPVLSGLAAVPLLAYCKVCSLGTDLDDELAKGHFPRGGRYVCCLLHNLGETMRNLKGNASRTRTLKNWF